MRLSIVLASILASLLMMGCASSTKIDSSEQATIDRFEVFKSGNVILSYGVWKAGRWRANSDALSLRNEGSWRELAYLVQRTGVDQDLAWYYLGRAAVGLGHPDAAKTYLQRSIEAANSGRSCDVIDFFSDYCDGFTFPDAAQAQLNQLNRAAAEPSAQQRAKD